ncbi:MAG TPA: cohesin domain-containing protein, partial [Bacteroidales bacterium]|nr:cohesin domain-containing protein [Bacteroidales bacterium]
MKTTETIIGSKKFSLRIAQWTLMVLMAGLVLIPARTQSQVILVNFDTINACPGSTVTIPVMVKNMSNIGGISMRIGFTSGVLTPATNYLINKNASLASLPIQIQNTVTNAIYFAAFGIGTTASIANGKLFDLVFTYNGGKCLVYADTVNGDNGAGDFEFADVNGTPQPVQWTDGYVIESGDFFTQPQDQTVNVGDPASFSVTTAGAIGYQWRVNTGSGWVSLSNAGVYSGVFTSTLNISAATALMDGYLYQCVSTGPCVKNSFTSQSATLNVSSGCNNAVANAGPNASVCSNGSKSLTGTALDYTTVLWTSAGDGIFTGANTLTPTYTPGANDILAGSVNLTLTAYATPPCTDGTDAMTLTIIPAVTGNAGSDESTCAGTPFSLTNSSVPPTASLLNSGIFWTENGPGSISNPTALAPTYTPTAAESGNVTLTMTVYG